MILKSAPFPVKKMRILVPVRSPAMHKPSAPGLPDTLTLPSEVPNCREQEKSENQTLAFKAYHENNCLLLSEFQKELKEIKEAKEPF